MGADESVRSEYQRERDLDGALAPAGYHCLHRCTPTASAEWTVDHVVIGPAGIFAITDANLAYEVRQGADGRVWCGGEPLDGRMTDAVARAAAISANLGTHAAAVMAVHGAEVRTAPVVRGVTLVAAPEVPGLILRRSPYCSAGTVSKLATRARITLSAGSWTVPTSS